MPKSVHPTFYTDRQLWEVDGYAEPSLRSLKAALPKGTRIIGYVPHGHSAPPKTDISRYSGRPVLPHSKSKQQILKHNRIRDRRVKGLIP